MMRTVYTPILSFLFLCLTITAFGQQLTLKPNFFNEKLEDGWDRPVGITFDENGQGYVWEKRGSVFILDKEGHKLATPLVSIDEEVMNVGDLGMLGFALDPQFTSNGYFYLLYVVDPHYLYTFGTS
ncbi:MAG: PQQ-dependent sugar dehydrogenase [Bacteroidota bacterium]